MSKKILICLMLAVSILSMSVFADSGNISMLFSALGTDTEIAENDDAFVTRGQFLRSLTLLLGCNTEIGDNAGFSDVEANSALASSINYALSLGLISRSDSFYPNREITYNEAYKMCVSALCRDYEAKSLGGYPAGYCAVAARTKLSKGIANTGSDKLTVADFYILIDNLLDAEMLDSVSINSDNEIGYYESTTILKKTYGIEKTVGIVTGDEHTYLYSGKLKTSDGYVRIDDKIYEYSGTCTLGERVAVYADADNHAFFIAPHKNKIENIKLEDIISVSSNGLRYYSGSTEKTLKLDTGAAVIYNGKADEINGISSLIDKDGDAVFIDNDGDNVYEAVHLQHARNIVVQGISKQNMFITDKNGEKPVRWENSTLICDRLPAEGELIKVFESGDGELIKIAPCADTLTGAVTALSQNPDEIYIDDKGYKYTDYFEKYYLNNIEIGSDASFMLSDGKICAVSQKDEGKMKFGYILAGENGKGLSKTVKLKLFTQSGENIIFELSDRVTLNAAENKDAGEVYASMFPGGIERQLVRYATDAQGKINIIDTLGKTGSLTGDEDGRDNLTVYEYPSNVYDSIHYIKSSGIVHPYYAISADTLVMSAALGGSVEDDKRCRILGSSYLNAHSSLRSAQTKAYNVSRDGVAGAVVIYDESAVTRTVDEDSAGGIVDSVTQALDPDGYMAYKLVVYTNSYFYDYYISDEDVINTLKNPDGSFSLHRGDYIRYNFDSSNYITVIGKDFDAAEKKVLASFENHIYYSYYYGRVYSKGGSYISLLPENIPNITGEVSGIKYTFMMPSKITIYDSATKQITDGTPEEIVSYIQAGDDCNRLLIRCDDGAIRQVILYR